MKKNFVNIIKNEIQNDYLVYKYPLEDFNINSTVIVNPGEVALFLNKGIIEKIFEEGMYNLETGNYPFLTSLKTLFSGGVSKYNCKIIFIRKSVSSEIKWGTQTPIQVRDKKYNIRVDVKTRGVYKYQIVEPKLFVRTLLGNNFSFSDQMILNSYFENEFQGKIKAEISKYINEIDDELIGIDSKIEEISKVIEKKLNVTLYDYGIQCVNFMIAALDVDKSKYDEIDNYQLEYMKKIKNASFEKERIDLLGNKWKEHENIQILKELASNGGFNSQIASSTMGIGLGFAAGDYVMNSVNRNPENLENDEIYKLKRLKELFELGLINENEYLEKKKLILDKM